MALNWTLEYVLISDEKDVILVLDTFVSWRIKQIEEEEEDGENKKPDISNDDAAEKKRQRRFKVTYPQESPEIVGLHKPKVVIQSAIRGPILFSDYQDEFPEFTGG